MVVQISTILLYGNCNLFDIYSITSLNPEYLPNMKEDFCFLAIRPMKDCHKNFQKNLKPGTLYKFYGGYVFQHGDDEVKTCGKEITAILKTEDKTVPDNLYECPDEARQFDLKISAIVGKNGSGKSSLLELFYAACFYLSSHTYLNDPDNTAELRQQVGDIFEKLNVEVYYIEGEIFKRVKIDSKNCFYQSLKSGSWEEDKVDQLPFYTVAVNYSLYGLNSSEKKNKWLKSLFHKNDGYQTPLVINPFREDGNINVNKEFHLAQSRLITNIGLSNREKYRLNEEVDAVRIAFAVDPAKLENLEDWSVLELIEHFEQSYGYEIIEFFFELTETVIDYPITNEVKDEIRAIWLKEIATEKLHLDEKENKPGSKKDAKPTPSTEYLLYLMLKYVIKKIYRICFNYYDEYGHFLEYDKIVADPLDQASGSKAHEIARIELSMLPDLLEKLKKDESHVTTKLKQALYSIKNGFHKELNWHVVKNIEYDCETLISDEIAVSAFSSIVKGYKIKGTVDELAVPAAFFIPKIKVLKTSDPETWEFEGMSSGEQQMVHSIQSVLYHITNINSVHKAPDADRARYSYVNIILDEIELYYHPQYQKRFIFEFLTSLRSLKIDNIKGINILFSTHSPFILSDIANWNVMKLEDGMPAISEEKTFAANIHDLLANDFFLQQGYTGQWANYKLQTFTETQYQPSPDDLRIVDLVGEPILRSSLRSLLMANTNPEEVDAEMERLKSLKNRMENGKRK